MNNLVEYVSYSEADTESIGAKCAECASNGDFFALYGDLGAGKTAFARGFTHALVPDAHVTSPSYAIINTYRGKTAVVNHFDVYRIKGEDDLESCGFFDLISDGITLCEWSDNIPFALPSERYDVKISKDGSTDNIRHITIEKTGDRL